MAANVHTSPEQRREHLERVAELYGDGLTQLEIASRLGVSRSTIAYDIGKLHEEWAERRSSNIDRAKYAELAKCDQVEHEAWLGWERSCKDREQDITETIAGTKTVGKTRKLKEGQAGDPRFLDVISRMVERRCKILGLDIAESKNPKDNEDLSDTAIRTRISELLGKAGIAFPVEHISDASGQAAMEK